jgi:hypothetical protein
VQFRGAADGMAAFNIVEKVGGWPFCGSLKFLIFHCKEIAIIIIVISIVIIISVIVLGFIIGNFVIIRNFVIIVFIEWRRWRGWELIVNPGSGTSRVPVSSIRHSIP